MFDWLKTLLTPPKPTGPPRRLRLFEPAEATLSRDGVSADEGGWRIDANAPRTVSLFEVAQPGVDRCVLTYRAQLKTAGVSGRVYLEMWCRFPGPGEFFSKGFDQALSGTTDWVVREIPFYLKKGQQPDLIKLNLAVEGAGTVWVREIELLTTPLA
ncbi:MAG: hypothetical protein Q8O34_11140 [Rhodocyclaceae bacterium]|nr:hypothetical protein [Rhodocyclaceae bacterium]